MQITEGDFEAAVERTLNKLQGIEKLYTNQMNVLRTLVLEETDIFLTAPTSSGKTIPPVILPSVLHELSVMGYNVPSSSRVLFVTAMNSIQLSLLTSVSKLGVKCAALTSENVTTVLDSDAQVLFVGPEVLKKKEVAMKLLQARSTFSLKVIDEVHLGKQETSLLL